MRRLITNISFTVFILVASVALVPGATVSAGDSPAPPAPAQGGQGGACAKNLLFPQWYDDLCEPGPNGSVKIKAPNQVGAQGGGDAESTGRGIAAWLLVIVMNIVKMLLTVVGYVSLAFVIWGGFKYMTQGDNSSGTAGARKTIQNAIIGLVLSMMSVAIINFITSAIV